MYEMKFGVAFNDKTWAVLFYTTCVSDFMRRVEKGHRYFKNKDCVTNVWLISETKLTEDES